METNNNQIGQQKSSIRTKHSEKWSVFSIFDHDAGLEILGYIFMSFYAKTYIKKQNISGSDCGGGGGGGALL